MQDTFTDFFFSLHWHKDREKASTTRLVGYEEGIRDFDSFAAGLGGCPDVPKRKREHRFGRFDPRRTGNWRDCGGDSIRCRKWKTAVNRISQYADYADSLPLWAGT